MTERIKPLKRNENLLVFSHEHHHGLIFCNRLKMSNQASDKILKVFVRDFWENHLSEHFENEEKLFLPLFRSSEIKVQFLWEHGRIKKLIKTIEESEGDIQKLSLDLADLINDHIRFEERIMFPWLEKTLNLDELKAIGDTLKDTEISAHNFLPAFWKNENQRTNKNISYSQQQ